MAKYTWKVWLRANNLTPDPNDYVAEVDTAGVTRTLQDIIDRLIAEGSEIKPETIRAIIERVNAIKRDFLLAGYSVFDEFIHIAPRVDGSWRGNETFTEGDHKVTVDSFLAKVIRDELKQIGVDVLGIAESGARIMLVTDIATQKEDGTITVGDDILIVGEKIKVLGLPQPEGAKEPGIGVFFAPADGSEAIEAVRISENQPSRLVARVPATLGEGQYTLRIVTRYTGAVLLRDPRVIEYKQPLKVQF
jgi:hypothetical protein